MYTHVEVSISDCIRPKRNGYTTTKLVEFSRSIRLRNFIVR